MSRRAHSGWLAVAALLVVGVASTNATQAAVDMFIKIEGIEGEATDSAHSKQIDVLSWSWGVSREPGAASTARRGGVEVADFSFTKNVDKATPRLMEFCAEGKPIPRAVLAVRRAGRTPVEYLIIELRDVMVTSVTTGGSGGDDRPTEQVTLDFAEVKLEYRPQKTDGSVEPPTAFDWSVTQGTSGSTSSSPRRRSVR